MHLLSRKQLIYSSLLPIVQLLVVLGINHKYDATILAIQTGLLLITGISSVLLILDDNAFSLNQVWWLFQVIFMGFVPSIQAAMGRTPWHSEDVLSGTLVRANAVVLGSMGLYILVRWLLKRRCSSSTIRQYAKPLHLPRLYVFWTLAILIFSAAVLVRLYGVRGLFLRGIQEDAVRIYNTTLLLLADKVTRGILLAVSLIAIYFYKAGKLPMVRLIVLLALVFLLTMPQSIPRYLALTIYGAWLITLGARQLRSRKYLFRIVAMSLLLLAPPVTSILRYAGTPEFSKRLSKPAEFLETTYLVNDFDAYSSLCRAIQHTDVHGTTAGRQLAGVALFFVPRTWWPAKPIGSGAFIFYAINQGYYLNVSCTFLAEGWINFGWAGSLLFAALLAMFIAWYDSFYQKYHGQYRYSILFYPAMIGLLLFILRGDLLSSFAYTVGLYVSGWMVQRILLSARSKQ